VTIPESWQPFVTEVPANVADLKRGRSRAISPQRQWTHCVMPIGSASDYCGKPGTWDDEFGATLCEYHSEREALKRKLKAEEIAEHLPEQVALNTLLASMRAHPATYRREMRRQWYGDDPYEMDADYNRGDK
jgi:hypothetical protein